MNGTVLPPSPNWYLSKILVCSKRGTVAWGSKNNIVITHQKEKGQILGFSVIKDTHKDKVTSLAFSPKCEAGDPELLISSGDDDKVKVWDVAKKELVMLFSFNDVNIPTVGLDWSIKNDKLAFAVNAKGILLLCNIHYETSNKLILGKIIPTCLACCPHQSNFIAIGSKTGLIYIIDLDRKELILYKLRGHDTEIVSLSWCPSDTNVLRGTDKRDLLLASGAKDRSVFIWRAGGDGRYETVLNLPKQVLISDVQRHKSKNSAAAGLWTAVCWAEPKVLLTSSVWGELLSWELYSINEPIHNKPVYKLFHTYHNRGLCCIATIPKNDVTDWRANSGLTVWTLAQDRWIICCRKQDNYPVELMHKIPTQGGYVYSIAPCPIDTSYVAFGAGDMMLRVWNLSDPYEDNFNVTMLWQKIKGKIRTIAWNPECERSLAFATSEGRVGVFDVISNNVTLFRQYHRNTVYKLEWGSVRDKDIFGVYSCAEGELVVHDIKNPDKEPTSIIQEGCTEFSWKADKSILAVASGNGSITFYNQDFKKCGSTIYIIKKTINCLTWHPESTETDSWASPMKDYLAVASDSPIITIFDISSLRKQLQAQEETVDPVKNEDNDQQCDTYKVVVTLKGHSDKVVCLAWSPLLTGYLVSGSYDNVAQVWNVGTEELIATYAAHSAPVLCCMWSPRKPQLIMTGSADFTLRTWDYTSPAQSPKQPVDVPKKKPKNKTQKQKKITNVSETQSNPITCDSTSDVAQSSDTTEIAETKPQISSIKKKKEAKSYFVLYGKMMNDQCNTIKCIRNDIKNIQEENGIELQSEAMDNGIGVSVLREKEYLLSMLTNEKSANIDRNRHDTVVEIDMWCDSLKENLELAVKEQRLTDFSVSLSASLSMKMWREMCEAYAHQLIRQGNVEKAVSYLLCVHKIYEAIKAFLDARMYKEAYILAKFKLDADDPVLAIVLQSWAQYTKTNGNFEQAAHCYVKLGEFAKAASALSCRRDLDCLGVASQLAFMADDKEFGASLAGEAISRALMALEYSKARSIFANIQQSQHLKVHIDAHEAIMIIYKKENQCDLVRTWLEGKSSLRVLQTLRDKYDASYYNALHRNSLDAAPDNQAAMQLCASYQIAMAAICDTREIQLKHIAKALNTVFQYETTGEKHSLKYIDTDFFTHLLVILDARKPTDEDSIYAKSDYPISSSIRGYLCSGLLNWLIADLQLLSIEEEIQFTELIETLLDDAFQQAAKDNVDRIDKIKQLDHQLARLMIDKESNTKDESQMIILQKELDNLKLDKKNFAEKRVCVPDPDLVRNQAFELSKILRDNTNRLRFLEALDNKHAVDVSSETDS